MPQGNGTFISQDELGDILEQAGPNADQAKIIKSLIDNGADIEGFGQHAIATAQQTPKQNLEAQSNSLITVPGAIVGGVMNFAGDVLNKAFRTLQPESVDGINNWLANRPKVANDLEQGANYNADQGNKYSALLEQTGAFANNMMPRHFGDVALQAMMGGSDSPNTAIPDIPMQDMGAWEKWAKTTAENHPYINKVLNLTGPFHRAGIEARNAADIADATSMSSIAKDAAKQHSSDLTNSGIKLGTIPVNPQGLLPIGLPTDIKAPISPVGQLGSTVQEGLAGITESSKEALGPLEADVDKIAARDKPRPAPRMNKLADTQLSNIAGLLRSTGDTKTLQALEKYSTPTALTGENMEAQSFTLPEMMADQKTLENAAYNMPRQDGGRMTTTASDLLDFAKGKREGTEWSLEHEIADRGSKLRGFTDARSSYNQAASYHIQNMYGDELNDVPAQIRNAPPSKVFDIATQSEENSTQLQKTLQADLGASSHYDPIRQQHINTIWNDMIDSKDPQSVLDSIEKGKNGYLDATIGPEAHSEFKNAAVSLKQMRASEATLNEKSDLLKTLQKPKERAGETGTLAPGDKRESGLKDVIDNENFWQRLTIAGGAGATAGLAMGGIPGAAVGAGAGIAGDFGPEMALRYANPAISGFNKYTGPLRRATNIGKNAPSLLDLLQMSNEARKREQDASK